MALVFLVALQAAAAPAATAAIDFDLARLRELDLQARPGARGCPPRDDGAIVVCGRRPSGGDYPMAEMARIFEREPPVAEVGLGGGATARAYGETAVLDRGAVTHRVMVRVRVPF